MHQHDGLAGVALRWRQIDIGNRDAVGQELFHDWTVCWAVTGRRRPCHAIAGVSSAAPICRLRHIADPQRLAAQAGGEYAVAKSVGIKQVSFPWQSKASRISATTLAWP